MSGRQFQAKLQSFRGVIESQGIGPHFAIVEVRGAVVVLDPRTRTAISGFASVEEAVALIYSY